MRRIGAAALAALLVLGGAPPAVADLTSELADVRGRIAELRAKAGDSRSARTEVANALIDAAAELESIAERLAEAERSLSETDREIASAEASIDELRGRIAIREERVTALRGEQEVLLDAARRRAVELYMSAHEDAGLPALPSDVNEARVSFAYAYRVQEVADMVIHDYEALRLAEAREVDLLLGERSVLESTVAALEVRRADQEAQREAVAIQREEVRVRLAEQRALLARIDSDIALIDGEIAALAREEGRIRQVIAGEQTGAGSAPSVLLRPVPGAVSSPYGFRVHPIFGDRRLHTGWDMNAGCGTPIKAAASGRVFLSGWHGGYGNTIIIDHGGGMATLYAHQSSLGASYNQQVTAGQVIGWVGTTGVSTGCHLHFEVRISGTPVDPAPYL
jgi:murein DD-endopeptidase MepM/ murein hydrolase activator NlpD